MLCFGNKLLFQSDKNLWSCSKTATSRVVKCWWVFGLFKVSVWNLMLACQRQSFACGLKFISPFSYHFRKLHYTKNRSKNQKEIMLYSTFYLYLYPQRPWHEYEHNFQIMYKVGMGHKPPIPEKLSTEGKDFLGHCLESEPKRRWTASMLLDHAFVKVRHCHDMHFKAVFFFIVMWIARLNPLLSLVCFRFVRMKSEWNLLCGF